MCYACAYCRPNVYRCRVRALSILKIRSTLIVRRIRIVEHHQIGIVIRSHFASSWRAEAAHPRSPAATSIEDMSSVLRCPVCVRDQTKEKWSEAQWKHGDPWYLAGRNCCVDCQDAQIGEQKTWFTQKEERISRLDYTGYVAELRDTSHTDQQEQIRKEDYAECAEELTDGWGGAQPSSHRSRSRSRSDQRRTSATRLDTPSQHADSKYREQFLHAYHSLQEAVENARTALDIVATLCCEEGLALTAHAATAEGCAEGIRTDSGAAVNLSSVVSVPAPPNMEDFPIL